MADPADPYFTTGVWACETSMVLSEIEAWWLHPFQWHSYSLPTFKWCLYHCQVTNYTRPVNLWNGFGVRRGGLEQFSTKIIIKLRNFEKMIMVQVVVATPLGIAFHSSGFCEFSLLFGVWPSEVMKKCEKSGWWCVKFGLKVWDY